MIQLPMAVAWVAHVSSTLDDASGIEHAIAADPRFLAVVRRHITACEDISPRLSPPRLFLKYVAVLALTSIRSRVGELFRTVRHAPKYAAASD